MKYDCLIIDDEKDISQTVCEYFNMFDIKSKFVTSYEEGMDFLEKNEVLLLLLDVNLGDKSGFIFCKELRKKSNVPVIFISAREKEEDILAGLYIGGDDYITKPFSLNILLAKAKAILKRNINQNVVVNKIIIDNIVIDRETAKVTKDDILVKLKPMEWKLLNYMVSCKNRLLSKDELMKNVWKDEFISEGTLSVHIRHLREKIENEPNNPQFIKTIWGMGYILEVIE